jgi:Fe-S cluster assembly protein SufD
MDINTRREEAAAAFAAKGLPTVKEEAWRFTNVSRLNEETFDATWQAAAVSFDPLSELVVVFENGKWSVEASSLERLPDGVRVRSIMDSAEARLGTLADSDSGFVLSNTAQFSDGVLIEVDAGVVLEEPIHVVHLADAEGGSFAYRHLIAAAAGAAVTIIEEYVGSAGVRYLTNVVTEAFVADGAKVDHYKIQRESAAAYHFQTLESELGRDALFSNHAVTVGGRLGRNDIRGRLLGEESEAICNGLYLLQEDQLFDTHLFMDHAVPKCQSHELYKGILSGQARAVFCGRILVQQDAQETDAIQSNGNLLLSRAAKVNTMPQLEIYADDVKCTHGATIGELDEQALFYLQTRGVDSKQAHAMLTFAFANEVLDEVACSVVKHRIESMVQAWLVGVNE